MPSLDTARIDIERFWTTIERSAEIGPGRPGGLSRLALSDADKEVRDIVADSAEFAQTDPEPDASELWTDVLL